MKGIYLQIALLVFFSLFSTLKGYNQTTANPEVYRAGYKVVRAVDSTRVYKPNSNTTDYLHYRPMDFDIWYPAKASSTDTILAFKDFLGLLEERAIYYTASDKWKGITGQVAQSFCEGFKCSDTARLFRFKTSSVKNAAPLKGKFPLVVYLTSYNGMGYENIQLFEDLASKGFVVVSINSIGRYPGDMTMKNADLMEQVKDADYAIQLLSKDEQVDITKIGIVGYSWGGLAGAILANRTPAAACLVSLDGSEFHHYGEAKQENEDFDETRNSKEFKAMHLNIPYLRLQSAPVNESNKDSVYDFTGKLLKDKTILIVDSADHQDFCYLPTLVRASGNCNNNSEYGTVTKLTESFLEDHLKGKNEFADVLQSNLDKTVSKQ